MFMCWQCSFGLVVTSASITVCLASDASVCVKASEGNDCCEVLLVVH